MASSGQYYCSEIAFYALSRVYTADIESFIGNFDFNHTYNSALKTINLNGQKQTLLQF